MTLSGNPKDLIWLPDLYIRNSLEIKKHTTGFTETARTTISSGGYIHISSRYFLHLLLNGFLFTIYYFYHHHHHHHRHRHRHRHRHLHRHRYQYYILKQKKKR